MVNITLTLTFDGKSTELCAEEDCDAVGKTNTTGTTSNGECDGGQAASTNLVNCTAVLGDRADT